MATLIEKYARVINSELRNRIEISLLTAAQVEIDASGTNSAYALTLLNQTTAQTIAQTVLRYLVVKYPDFETPTDEQINTAVGSIFAKLAGGV